MFSEFRIHLREVQKFKNLINEGRSNTSFPFIRKNSSNLQTMQINVTLTFLLKTVQLCILKLLAIMKKYNSKPLINLKRHK